MKVVSTITACVAIAGSTYGFTPVSTLRSASSLQASYTPEYEGMLGTGPETGGGFWDPFGFSEYIPAEWARKAELANGRSAMLATVGWFWPNVVGKFASDDVTTSDPIKAMGEANLQWWAQFIILCGTIEAYKYRQEQEGVVPQIDWSMSWPKDDVKKQEILQVQELKNARLAMIGVASFVSAHYIPGSVPLLPVDFQ